MDRVRIREGHSSEYFYPIIFSWDLSGHRNTSCISLSLQTGMVVGCRNVHCKLQCLLAQDMQAALAYQQCIHNHTGSIVHILSPVCSDYLHVYGEHQEQERDVLFRFGLDQ
jgi:hypothetical protein